MTSIKDINLDKFTVAQIAAAITAITGETVTAKSFNYKGKALDRLRALITERGLSVRDVLIAAGIEAVRKVPRKVPATNCTAEDETISGLGITPASASAKPVRKPRNSKQAQLIAMLKRPEGASIDEIVSAFGWQPHTARGAIAGALKKKLGLAVSSEKIDGHGRIYKIKD